VDKNLYRAPNEMNLFCPTSSCSFEEKKRRQLTNHTVTEWLNDNVRVLVLAVAAAVVVAAQEEAKNIVARCAFECEIFLGRTTHTHTYVEGTSYLSWTQANNEMPAFIPFTLE